MDGPFGECDLHDNFWADPVLSARRAASAHPTAEWTAQQLREAFPWESAPGYLLRDRDRIFGEHFVAQVKAPPAADMRGRWNVEVAFFSSKSQHTLTLEQDGNRLSGSHKGDFSVRDVFGTIEGDQIKLQSTDSRPGDSITFTFSGSLSGDTFSGPVYMGEYLNAKFTAKRHPYPERRGTILIPGGPPLAN